MIWVNERVMTVLAYQTTKWSSFCHVVDGGLSVQIKAKTDVGQRSTIALPLLFSSFILAFTNRMSPRPPSPGPASPVYCPVPKRVKVSFFQDFHVQSNHYDSEALISFTPIKSIGEIPFLRETNNVSVQDSIFL